jgi:polar amino acid transport system substrate-binding protein
LFLTLSSCSKDNNNSTKVGPKLIAEESTLNAILKRKKLMVGMDVADIRYQPFEMKDEKGEIVGFDVDLAKMMADELGVTLEIVQTSWDGIIPALINGKFDVIISGMSITTERNKAINFSRPYFLSGKCILINIGYAGRISSYYDLDRQDIVVTATFYDDMVLDRYIPNAKIFRYDTDEEAVLEVIEGRAHAYVADKARVTIFAKENPNSTRAIMTPFTYEPIAVGMRKGDPDLLNWIDNFIEIINGDGRLAMLEQKWMISDVESEE